ncbi:MAG: gamma-glutamyl-gamma-aminobutyrate hydrolase family protein [Sphaerochaetaceae bacterium]|jgi:putative glutamine amidotransferase
MTDGYDRPVIGIAGTLDAPPQSTPFSDIRRDITNEAYTRSIRLAGGVPVLLTVPCEEPIVGIEEFVSLCDGILFPGGYDIDPSYYGQRRHELLGPTDVVTDRFQFALYHAARIRRTPILGICRGCQVINVAQGGTLWQDQSLRPVEGTRIEHRQYAHPTEGCHQAFLEPGSQVASLFPGPHLLVNSLHHQQLDEIGTGLAVSARSEDGGVEAIESIDDGRWTVGIQWHPEAMMMRNDMMLPIFLQFVLQAKNRGRTSYGH